MSPRRMWLGVMMSILAGGLALAGPGTHPRHGGSREDRMERLARRLDLTEGQRARMKEIFEKHRSEGLGEAAERARAARRELRDLIHDPDAADSDVRVAAKRSAEASADLAVERHRAFAEAFSVLTPEQRERARGLKRL